MDGKETMKAFKREKKARAGNSRDGRTKDRC